MRAGSARSLDASEQVTESSGSLNEDHDDQALGSARKFAGNAVWMLIGDVTAKAVAFLFIVIVARGIGTTGFGHFNFAISFIPLFLIGASWGLGDILFREVARDREHMSKYFATGFVLRATLGTAAVAIALILARFLIDDTAAFGAVALIGLALLFDELGAFITHIFKAFEEMRFRAIRILVNRILTTSLALIAVLMGGGLWSISAMYALGSLGGFVYAWVALRRHFPPVRLSDRNRSLMKTFLRQGAPLGVASALNMAVFRLDATMLQGMEGPVAVAMYGVAYRFFDSFMFVAWALANVMLPRVARSGKSAAGVRTYEISLMGSLAFYLPLAVGAPFTIRWLVPVVFGERYDDAAGAALLLVPAVAAYGAGYVARYACMAVGQRKEIMWVAAGALCFNVLGNLYAIPRWSFVGAAVVTLATGALEAIALTTVFLRENARLRFHVVFGVPGLAAAGMGAVLVVASLSDLIAIIVGVAVYLPLLFFAGKLLAPEETSFAMRLLRRTG